MRKQMRKNIGL